MLDFDPNEIVNNAIHRGSYIESIKEIASTIDSIIADAKASNIEEYQEEAAQYISKLAFSQLQNNTDELEHKKNEVSICLNSVLAYLFGIREQKIAERLLEILCTTN